MRVFPMMLLLEATLGVLFVAVLGDTYNGEAEDLVAAWAKPYNLEEGYDVVNLLKESDLKYPRQPRGPPEKWYMCFRYGDLMTLSETDDSGTDIGGSPYICQKHKVQHYDIERCNRMITTRSYCNGFDVNITYFETEGFAGQDCESYNLLTDYMCGDADMEDLKDLCLRRNAVEELSSSSTQIK